MPRRLENAKLAPDGMSIQIRRFRLGGLALRVWRISLDDAPGVEDADRRDFVLVHGIGVSSVYFEPLAARLAHSGNVYLLDLPGFDGVPRPEEPLTIGGFADLVTQWVAHLGLRNPVLVGHSMGAQVVAEMLARTPDISEHAVLVGPPVNAAERSPLTQSLRLVQSSWHESSKTRQVALRGYLNCGPQWFLQVLPELLRYQIEDRLPLARAKVLIIRGTHDVVAPRNWIADLAGLCQLGRCADLDGAAHAVIYEHSAETAELVLGHIQT